MVKKLAKYLFPFFGIEVRKSPSPRFNKLGSLGIPYGEWEPRRNYYYLKVFDLTVKDLNSPLIAGYEIAKGLTIQGGGRFYYDDNRNLRLTIKGVNFFINSTDELFVIREVFVWEEYNFKTKDEIVVIDIGLNIGAASLFFAMKNNVRRIYAYELFEPTFLAAMRNLSINDQRKILCFNVGLGKETKQLSIPYSFANKARMGLNGLPPSENFHDATMVSVTVKDVAEEIIRISGLEPNVRKVCKIDCEGSEFEILERLFQKNVAELIDGYLIEWHLKNTEDIEESFIKNGFDIIKTTGQGGETGLLYAFKSPSM